MGGDWIVTRTGHDTLTHFPRIAPRHTPECVYNTNQPPCLRHSRKPLLIAKRLLQVLYTTVRVLQTVTPTQNRYPQTKAFRRSKYVRTALVACTTTPQYCTKLRLELYQYMLVLLLFYPFRTNRAQRRSWNIINLHCIAAAIVVVSYQKHIYLLREMERRGYSNKAQTHDLNVTILTHVKQY